MGKLLHFPKLWTPSRVENERLESLQRWFRETNASIHVESKFDKYQIVIRRQHLANRLRDKWKLLNGFVEKPESLHKHKRKTSP